MIKFVTDDYKPQIGTVEVDKETAASVWIKGNRKAKRSDWKNYHDTWQEAKQFLLDAEEDKMDRLQSRMERVKSKHDKIEGLKQPN